jgi:hypothetical protein
MSKRKATAAPEEAEPVAKRWDGDNDVRIRAFVTKDFLHELLLAMGSATFRSRNPSLHYQYDDDCALHFFWYSNTDVRNNVKLEKLFGWFAKNDTPTSVVFLGEQAAIFKWIPLLPYSSYPAWRLASLDRRAVVRFAHDHGVLLWREGQLPMPDYYIRNYPWWRHWVLKGLQKKTCADVVNKVFEFIGLPLHSL